MEKKHLQEKDLQLDLIDRLVEHRVLVEHVLLVVTLLVSHLVDLLVESLVEIEHAHMMVTLLMSQVPIGWLKLGVHRTRLAAV